MVHFGWNPGFDIGVVEMNNQHRQILQLMDRLYRENSKGEAKPHLRKTLIELRDYTEQHFAEEEAYMQKVSFPDFNKHRLIHKTLLEQFGQHMQEFEDGSGKLSEGFFHFLQMWLSAHIKGIDRRYGEFVIKKVG